VRLTKYSHSCLRLVDGDRSLVIDPGVFSESDEALSGTDAVLITHEHPDHLDVGAVRAAAAANTGLEVWAPTAVAESLTELGSRVHAVESGEQFEAAGFSIAAVGGQHALIHPTIPVIANLGYLIDGTVYHPGDSLIVPNVPVQTLFVPLHAPWSKLAEVADFVVSVRAGQTFQLHDAMLSTVGSQATEGMLTRVVSEHGLEFAHLDTKQTIDA
jgi:glyoxylase-like metal-dependent hydrolase (beta-lactamase superfamily II)